jgi:UDP-N-acetylmuramoyl-L-alanyl-D-glutamate--2,6-diaminopimelate ligase
MISMLDWLPEYPELAGIKANGISLDSREVSRGSIFIALKGYSVDGHDYIDSAISNGAVAVLAEKKNIHYAKQRSRHCAARSETSNR